MTKMELVAPQFNRIFSHHPVAWGVGGESFRRVIFCKRLAFIHDPAFLPVKKSLMDFSSGLRM